MSSRTPEPPSLSEAEGIPDPQDLTASQQATGQGDGATEPPGDVAVAVEEFGTTPSEQRDGEPLAGRLAREEPDVLAAAGRDSDSSDGSDTAYGERGGQGVGRLVEPDEGAHTDTESELIATDVGTDLGGYAAEESAMHLEPEL